MSCARPIATLKADPSQGGARDRCRPGTRTSCTRSATRPPPVEVTAAPCQEVILTGEDVTQPGNGSAALPVPIPTPSFDAAPYFTGDGVGCGARTWARRRTLPETNVPPSEIDAGN